ncbi:sulfur carrier protein ThiS [Novosphingobium beihaiensis]|uniref:Sulfur carrier protein ThiS n=1 Tax=Novosphingobium beihaiensis TaxID=2930389 RepID=A0ABT0BRA1_9SPHN|nr:sulfur carrier protein ThiS [Novosphingobium beihaiensis]MCJ2187485.1 sulfur carrier protein ThiS [Novosphingobium beihaiensis]
MAQETFGESSGETSGGIRLTVNGEPRRIASGAAIADLVSSLGLDPKKVAVEHNAEIAPRSMLAEIVLADGDVLEIVHFVGGG